MCVCIYIYIYIYTHTNKDIHLLMGVVQKVLSCTQKEEPWLNIFVVATQYHFFKNSDFSLNFSAGEAHTNLRGV